MGWFFAFGGRVSARHFVFVQLCAADLCGWLVGLCLNDFLGQGNREEPSACVLKGEGICWYLLVLLVAQCRESGLTLRPSVVVAVAVVSDQLWCCDVV